MSRDVEQPPRLRMDDPTVDACLNCTVPGEECDGMGRPPGCQFHAAWKQKHAEDGERQKERRQRAEGTR
jgi:hypothetical protein